MWVKFKSLKIALKISGSKNHLADNVETLESTEAALTDLACGWRRDQLLHPSGNIFLTSGQVVCREALLLEAQCNFLPQNANETG